MKVQVSAHFGSFAALLARGRALQALLPAVALIAVFLLDLLQPSTVVFSILYVIPIVLTVGLGRPRVTYLAFVVASVATVAGAAFGMVPQDRTAALINRVLALVAQVLAAAVVIQQLELREREREAADERARRLDALQDQERQKDEFLSMAAHELRTPISTLRGYAQMAQAGAKRAGAPDVVAVAARILRQVDRLARLVADLADISRIDSGGLDLHHDTLDLVWLVREVLEEQRIANPGRHLDLLCDGTLPALHADAQRLEQVLNNLVDNAIKYSPEGGPVHVRLWRDGAAACVSVRDEGIGIPPGEQERLFERFYRAQSGARRFRGLGAGLYISRRIVEGHGGRIWVESSPEQGSTFGIALPIA